MNCLANSSMLSSEYLEEQQHTYIHTNHPFSLSKNKNSPGYSGSWGHLQFGWGRLVHSSYFNTIILNQYITHKSHNIQTTSIVTPK